MTKEELKQSISDQIYSNQKGLISGNILQEVLLDIADYTPNE
jgi:hypothetical protein